MIGTIDVKVNANHVNLPLPTLYSFVGSPSNIRITNVPKRVGEWKITNVYVKVNYPDNTLRTVEAKLIGGVYVATLPQSTVAGKSTNGYSITADGKDENGQNVTNYILGVGDVEILAADGSTVSSATAYYVNMHDSIPAVPNKADMVLSDGQCNLYDGSNWVKVDTLNLSGTSFDFSTMRGVYNSLSAIIYGLGGTITNFPTFQV